MRLATIRKRVKGRVIPESALRSLYVKMFRIGDASTKPGKKNESKWRLALARAKHNQLYFAGMK